MQANVNFKELQSNPSLLGFFFRTQSEDTFNELLGRSALSIEDTLTKLNDATWCDELDTIEEDFYELSVEELADQFDIELID